MHRNPYKLIFPFFGTNQCVGLASRFRHVQVIFVAWMPRTRVDAAMHSNWHDVTLFRVDLWRPETPQGAATRLNCLDKIRLPRLPSSRRPSVIHEDCNRRCPHLLRTGS
jgi:hypothetical protein